MSQLDPFPRNANSAGSPLPLIPRRTTSTSRVYSLSHSVTTPSKINSPSINVQRATPPKEVQLKSESPVSPDSDSSSSERSFRPKRERGVRVPSQAAATDPPSPPLTSLEWKKDVHKRGAIPDFEGNAATEFAATSSIPSSQSQPLIYTPGMPLRLSLEGLKSQVPKARLTGQHSDEANPSETPPPIVRKKSGQLVKSSLKSSKSVPRGSLSVVTGMTTSKSEPNTPSLKAVHFDSKLEHVKLFLAEQKPRAVSRDGSPTDDTSGTDSDFPPFIFGQSDEQRSQRRLLMQVANMPSTPNPHSDISLRELRLDSEGTSIVGSVRVRNLAFDKWLAVRFTFDAWQTTSEVTGKYVESVDKDFDDFSFNIRLNDILARIEGKTLIMALRYVVGGREIWDNNNGQNYLATFVRTKERLPRVPKSIRTSEDKPGNSDIADLRSRLEIVAKGRERADVSSPTQAKSAAQTVPWKTSGSLASRYDFAASLKQPNHTRTLSYPAQSYPALATATNSVPFPEKTISSAPLGKKPTATPVVKPKPALGSPRDLDHDTFRPAPFVPSDLDEPQFATPVPRVARNHQRGYFDIAADDENSKIRKTPPGTPRTRDLSPFASSRFYSFPGDHATPPPLFGAGVALGLTPRDAASSESGSASDSTPLMLSPADSSPPTSPSPVETFVKAQVASGESPGTSYHQFLDK